MIDLGLSTRQAKLPQLKAGVQWIFASRVSMGTYTPRVPVLGEREAEGKAGVSHSLGSGRVREGSGFGPHRALVEPRVVECGWVTTGV